jgi:hypothetical protein
VVSQLYPERRASSVVLAVGRLIPLYPDDLDLNGLRARWQSVFLTSTNGGCGRCESPVSGEVKKASRRLHKNIPAVLNRIKRAHTLN